DRGFEAWVSSETTNSTPDSPNFLKPSKKSRQLHRLSRLASSTASIWRRPSKSTATAMSTAWLPITPLADALIAGAENEIRIGVRKPSLEKARKLSSRLLLMMALIELSEKLWPHKASVTAFPFLVETPCTYISANVPTKAFSELLMPLEAPSKTHPVLRNPKLQSASQKAARHWPPALPLAQDRRCVAVLIARIIMPCIEPTKMRNHGARRGAKGPRGGICASSAYVSEGYRCFSSRRTSSNCCGPPSF